MDTDMRICRVYASYSNELGPWNMVPPICVAPACIGGSLAGNMFTTKAVVEMFKCVAQGSDGSGRPQPERRHANSAAASAVSAALSAALISRWERRRRPQAVLAEEWSVRGPHQRAVRFAQLKCAVQCAARAAC